MNTTAAVALVLPLGLILMILYMIYSNKGAGAVRKSLASILSIYEPDFKSGEYNRAVRTIISNTDHITDEIEKSIYYVLAGRALVAAEDYRQALFCIEIATPGFPKFFEGSYKEFQEYKDECAALGDQCREKLDADIIKETTSAADSLKNGTAKEIAAWFDVA
jgi:hypothetical protein